MYLPSHDKLPTNVFSSVFKSTTATYKFYWLLAIIESVEQGGVKIQKKELFARMIANSWYPITYFHLSFGSFDLLQKAINDLVELENIKPSASKTEIIDKLIISNNLQTIKLLKHFDSNVPHWFLTPWFTGQSKSQIYLHSQDFENQALYSLDKDYITINPIWITYLKTNAKIIKDFCLWNLCLFIQTRNPNVPDVVNKLVKPAKRNSLQKQVKDYWELVIQELGYIECIFTGKKLEFSKRNFAMDHFVPYAFVSHDLIWNLIPIDSSFNSRKSDKLPHFDKYFDKFKELQKTAFEIHLNKKSKSKILEEYLTIFPTLFRFDDSKLQQTIQPLLTIASNNGFNYLPDVQYLD